MIYTAKAQMIEIAESKRFERALARWKFIWDLSEKGHVGGFVAHSEEVWLLAHKFLQADIASLVSRFGVDDMAQARRWAIELNQSQDLQSSGQGH